MYKVETDNVDDVVMVNEITEIVKTKGKEIEHLSLSKQNNGQMRLIIDFSKKVDLGLDK